MLKSIHAVFSNRRLRKLWVKLRALFCLGLFVLLLTRADPVWFWLGFSVTMAGEFFQLWCFASLDKKGTLAAQGLYGVVRNPMYLARFFVVFGYIFLLGKNYLTLGVAVAYIVLYYFYMVNRVKREEAALQEIFGQAYTDYCRQINRFLPSFKGAKWGSIFHFRWKLLWQNHGPWNLLGVLVSYAIAYYVVFRPF